MAASHRATRDTCSTNIWCTFDRCIHDHFGVICCTCLKMDHNSRTAGRRTKQSAIWDSWWMASALVQRIRAAYMHRVPVYRVHSLQSLSNQLEGHFGRQMLKLGFVTQATWLVGVNLNWLYLAKRQVSQQIVKALGPPALYVLYGVFNFGCFWFIY